MVETFRRNVWNNSSYFPIRGRKHLANSAHPAHPKNKKAIALPEILQFHCFMAFVSTNRRCDTFLRNTLGDRTTTAFH
ncbi:MAG: hypothetical protein RLP02_23315 [Coleofasciculus sp. C2-GNP5-27]